MSWSGKQGQILPQAPADVQGLRNQMAAWLGIPGQGAQAPGRTFDVTQKGGMVPVPGGKTGFGGPTTQMPGMPGVAANNGVAYGGQATGAQGGPSGFMGGANPASFSQPPGTGGFNMQSVDDIGVGGSATPPWLRRAQGGNDLSDFIAQAFPGGIGRSHLGAAPTPPPPPPGNFSGMFTNPNFVGQSLIDPVAQVTQAQLGPAPITGQTTIADPRLQGMAAQAQAVDPGNAAQSQAGQVDLQGLLGMLRQQTGGGTGAQMAGAAAQAGPLSPVQSVDQLGGVNSAFFNNMMNQLAPAFAQRRAEGLANAKEAAGNLSGSGFANALGGAVNRSLGDEQAALAGYASQGLGQELNRQLQLAQMGLTRDTFNAGEQNQLAGLNAQLGTQAGMARNSQVADILRTLGGQNAAMTTQNNQFNAGAQNDFGALRAQLGTNTNLANMGAQNSIAEQLNQIRANQSLAQGQIDAQRQAQIAQLAGQFGLAQGDIARSANELFANLTAQRANNQAGLNQGANLFNAGSANQAGQFNAGNFQQTLLAMLTGGVGAPQATYTPGLSDQLGSLLGNLPFAMQRGPR